MSKNVQLVKQTQLLIKKINKVWLNDLAMLFFQNFEKQQQKYLVVIKFKVSKIT